MCQNKSVCTTVSKYIGKIKVEIKEILSSFTNTVIEYINKTTFWNLIQTPPPSLKKNNPLFVIFRPYFVYIFPAMTSSLTFTITHNSGCIPSILVMVYIIIWL